MFFGARGNRLSARRFREQWVKACQKAGIENFHVHDIRHIGLTLVVRAARATEVTESRLIELETKLDLTTADIYAVYDGAQLLLEI